LNGGWRTSESGWRGEGPVHSAVTLTFGECSFGFGHSMRTTRTIYAKALNELSLMTPNLTKGDAE
jgi:hypothetical protein